MNSDKKQKINEISEMAILIAIAVVLDAIAGLFSPFKYGGSISPAMLPIFVISYRLGWKNGVLSGFIFGILSALVAAGMGQLWFLTIPQFLLDYIVPFALLGFAGIFKNPLTNRKSFAFGMIFGSILRYLSHGFAGILFWAEYTPEEFNPWVYSFLAYNLPYMLLSLLLCLLIGMALYNRNILLKQES